MGDVPTPSLSRFAELPWEVRPLGELRDGAVVWAEGVWPPSGACGLVLWRPGARPQFVWARGRLWREGRVWRFSGAAVAAWVVLVVAEPF